MSGPSRRARRPELSQHFLRRGTLAASLVDSAAIDPGDLVVEIGPGTGVLTKPLQASARRLIAVELDRDLARDLRARFSATPKVEVVEADILRYRFPPEPVRVVGNIPYARTADIVRRLTAAPSVIDAHLVVQREAGERFAGAPMADESLVSLSLKPWWHVEVVRQLRRTDFEPPPRVDSVVLWLARRTPSLVAERERGAYQAFLKQAFGRHRAMRQVLAALFTREQARRLASDLRIDANAPPSAIRFEQWLALYRFRRLAGRESR